MNDSAFFMNVVFIGLLVFTGISITLFVVFKILNRFNDFGDSFCKMDDYAPRAIHFLRDIDDVPSNEKRFLFAEYGENPYEGRQHTIPEQLLKNAKKESIEEQFDQDMEKYT